MTVSSPIANIDDVTKRLSRILFRTPQASFLNVRPSTLDEALDTIERVMTEDYAEALRHAAALEEELRRMHAERDVVRSFFGAFEE